MLEAILAPLRQRIVRAGSGEQALQQIARDDFALVFLDVRMPVMDGFQTAARIKARPGTRKLPILFITAADASPDDMARAYLHGVDFIVQPCDPRVIRAKAALFIEWH